MFTKLLRIGFLSGALLLSLMCLTSTATEETGAADDAKLKEVSAKMDSEAATADGKKMVVQRLEDQFQVEQPRIDGLRDKKLGYGEIGITFSLAQQMSGGINDANIQKIMDLRQGDKKGWGNVSRELGLNLGRTVRQMENVTETNQPASGPKISGDRAETTSKPERSNEPSELSQHGWSHERGITDRSPAAHAMGVGHGR